MNFSTNAPLIALQTGWPSLWLGDPGIGKTQMFYSLARFFLAEAKAAGRIPESTPLDHYAPDLVLSHYDPSDIGGIPSIAFDSDGDSVQSRALTTWAKTLIQLGEGIIFIDEINTAMPSQLAAALKLINEKKTGDHTLPDSVRIVAAGNRTNVGGNYEMTATASNRLWHYEYRADMDVWAGGFLAGFPDPEIKLLPETWRNNVPEMRALIVGFLRSKPELLHSLPADDSEQSKPWPSPRSWDMAADLLAAAKEYDGNEADKGELLLGAVGPAGYEALSYIEHADLQNPEEILAEPIEDFVLPERGDQKFAVLGSVAAAVQRNLTDDRWIKGWDVMASAATQGAMDVAVVSARVLCSAYKSTLAESGHRLPTPATQLPPFIEILSAAGLYGKSGK